MAISATTPLWNACRTLLAAHAGKFFSEWSKAAATFEEEDVHDFRVASRRLREALALFAPVLPPKRKKRLSREVKRVTRMLGDLRNTDEAFAFFSQLSTREQRDSQEEVEDLLSGLRREREEAHRRLREELAQLDPAPWQAEFATVQDGFNLFGAGEAFTDFAAFAGVAIMERADAVAELVPEATREENGAAQHLLRIAIKKLRYRLEIMEPLVSEGYEELRGTLKKYQDALGKLHDVDVFSAMVQERTRPGAGRESLMAVIAQRRKGLFGEFLQLLRNSAVQEVGKKAKEAIRDKR